MRAGFPARAIRLPADVRQHRLTQRHRRHRQLAIVEAGGEPRQRVEQLGRILADVGVDRE